MDRTTTAMLSELLTALQTATAPCPDAERVDRIRLLEEIKSAAAAAQAVETARFVSSQRQAQRRLGVRAEKVGSGIAAEVALAKRCSPWQAQRYVGWSMILTGELPRTLDQLRAGRITEWRSMLVARETAWLSRADRARVDSELAPKLEGWADRRVESETKRAAYRLDPHGYVDRLRRAPEERTVTLRPAPDAMSRLSMLVPVAQGVACYAALRQAADGSAVSREDRTRNQVMADTAVERITGQAVAGDVPVEVCLVMTDDALLNAPVPASSRLADEPALLHADGVAAVTVPAQLARDLVTRPSDATPMWLRRLYTRPGSRELMTMNSTRRAFLPNQRLFVRCRDQFCRTPWCGAPIRHVDHVRPAARGGPTDVRQAQGVCEACNYAKEAPGWSSSTRARDPDRIGMDVVLITATGHRYESRAPDPPGAFGPPRDITPDEAIAVARVQAAFAKRWPAA